MKKYKTVDEIRTAFIKKGWENPIFEEVTEEELKERFSCSYEKILKNGPVFRMKATGNLFGGTGEVIAYNIKALETPISIPSNR